LFAPIESPSKTSNISAFLTSFSSAFKARLTKVLASTSLSIIKAKSLSTA
jgi:hypothetical protein